MRPPICAICSKRWDCTLIRFKRSKAQDEFDEKCKKGFVGHPPDAEWFCEKHAKIAKKYAHLEIDEAREKILKELKKSI